MKRLVYLGLTLIAAGLTGCTTYDYYTAAINKTNLSNYHTFEWLPTAKNGNAINNLADAKIRDAANAALTSKGLQLTTQNPDLIVSYTTKVGRGTKINYYSPYYGAGFYPGLGLGWGWGWGYRPYFYAFGAPYAYYGNVTYSDKEHYREGTLIIDLVDARTHKIVWRGFGVGEVHRDPQKNIDNLPKEVTGLLNQLQLTSGTYQQSRQI